MPHRQEHDVTLYSTGFANCIQDTFHPESICHTAFDIKRRVSVIAPYYQRKHPILLATKCRRSSLHGADKQIAKGVPIDVDHGIEDPLPMVLLSFAVNL